ncbi:uncharacterized protein LOC132875619 [Neoarius graeffei]|uniref:uncharacterized protein LOC132875619 n=1 Tax=Neoarius graeffei TaxID=443677 RepID=UPI00298CC4D5|nr:uncharacterized protein LOC132875619 [Neoarius graeffei]
MTAPKGLPVITEKRTHSRKSGCIADEGDASRTPNGNKGDVARMYIGCRPFTVHAGGMNCVCSADIKGCSTHAVSIKRKDVLAATSIHLYYISFLKKATLIHLYYILYQHHGASVRQEKEVRAYSFKPWQGEEAAADVSCEDAQRMQRGYSRRLTDDNGHRTFVARICRGFTSYTAESSSVLKVLCSSKLFARMKSQWTDARWIERMKHVCNEYTTDA